MSTPQVEGGRGLRLRLFGFTVHIDLSFVLVMALIGSLSGGFSIPRILLFVAVATVAVLLHELGHAVVARTTGARPVIALSGFGGVTMYAPPRPLTRARSLAIAVAGPFAGLAAGAVLWVLNSTYGPQLAPGSWLRLALGYGLFTTIAWSVLNLLPVLPLDGGQAMRELLPGDPEVRARRAALVSLVVLVPLFGLALYLQQMFVAVFLVVFGVSNFQALSAGRSRAAGGQGGFGRAAGGPARPGPAVSPEQAVVALLWQGSPARARQQLESAPPDTQVDLAVHGAVLATTDQPDQGLALLAQERSRRPDDANVVALLVLAHLLRHDWDAVFDDLRAPWAALIPLAVVERAMSEAAMSGRQDVAARLGAMPRPEPR